MPIYFYSEQNESIPHLYPVLRSVKMLAFHLCLGFATGLFPFGFLTIHYAPEDPPLPLSFILSLEMYLVRSSSHEVAHYAVFFSLLLLPPSQAQYTLNILFSAQKPVPYSVSEIKYHT
jgi:hypothetical protein